MDTGCKDEVVIGDVAIVQVDHATGRVDTDDFIHENIYVALTAEDGPQRHGNFILRKKPACDLIQHWAKEVIVSFVDERHVNRCAIEFTRCVKTAKSTTHNDNAR
jgi:hypothetical protein